MQTTMTSKGQVTIPRDLRQHLGLRQGMAVEFSLEGDHLVLRPARAAGHGPASGFGLIQSRSGTPAVPADLDPASLVNEAP